ncbi:hypothetical protein KOR42_45060 [Thalassoglobus neptunius]|uniref:Uncharacterized protein n=1 Tax=Thalassoglobus neptunius TaxID=1938619 RepID=A0A5C5VWJ4_9PLAN|nr:hypothetical protein KOR42_45060 [Thalassoglobus neptunius]
MNAAAASQGERVLPNSYVPPRGQAEPQRDATHFLSPLG